MGRNIRLILVLLTYLFIFYYIADMTNKDLL